MRIISGKYKRRVISPPKNLPVRPTTDMAKESLFNILNNYIDFNNTTVLDLFAGTGNISYEFVSRGCPSVTAIDKDFGCVKYISKIAEDLQMTQLTAVRLDVFRFIMTSKNKYDMIFADPPYQLSNISEISDLVFEYELLNPGGWLIIEHPAEINFAESIYFHEHRKYGRVNFSFFHFITS